MPEAPSPSLEGWIATYLTKGVVQPWQVELARFLERGGWRKDQGTTDAG